MSDYIPTTSDIRDGFALNYSRDYEDFSDGYYEALRFGEAAFSSWLAEYTRQQREEAWDKGVQFGYEYGHREGVMSMAYAVPEANPYREETP